MATADGTWKYIVIDSLRFHNYRCMGEHGIHRLVWPFNNVHEHGGTRMGGHGKGPVCMGRPLDVGDYMGEAFHQCYDMAAPPNGCACQSVMNGSWVQMGDI